MTNNDVCSGVDRKFDLIVFPFRKTELTQEHRRVLDIVRSRLGKNARVTVEGRTDLIGSTEERMFQRVVSIYAVVPLE
jgi:outer membrane protein OmpA-like peptidoglycan-associated protein